MEACIGHENDAFPDDVCGSAAAARVSLMIEPAANAVTAIPAAAIPGTDFLMFMTDNLQAIDGQGLGARVSPRLPMASIGDIRHFPIHPEY